MRSLKRFNPGFLIPAVTLAVLFGGWGSYWSATWWSKWAILTLAFSVVFGAWVGIRRHWAYAPITAWVLAQAAALAFFGAHHRYGGRGPLFTMALQQDAVFTWMTSLGLVWVFTVFTPRCARPARLALALLWAAGTFVYLTMPPGMPPNNGWQFGNPSMGGSLLAALLPLVWDFAPGLGWALTAWLATFLMAYRTGASIPVGVLAVVTVAYWTPGLPWRRLKWLGLLAPLGFLAGFFYVQHGMLGKDLFDENQRRIIWGLAWHWSVEQGMLFWGWGAGAVQALMPLLQTQYGIRPDTFYVWLHSDWLQVLIEYGVPGLVFTGMALGRLLWVAWKTRARGAGAALFGFVGMGLFNYPIRLPITAWALTLVCCLLEAESEVFRAGRWSGRSTSSPAPDKLVKALR